MPGKSRTLRVATMKPWVLAIAAMAQSAKPTGLPCACAPALLAAKHCAARVSNATHGFQRVRSHGWTRLAPNRPAVCLAAWFATTASNSAKLMLVIKRVAGACALSQSTTTGLGAGLRGSDTTLVSRMIIRSSQVRLGACRVGSPDRRHPRIVRWPPMLNPSRFLGPRHFPESGGSQLPCFGHAGQHAI